MNLYQDLWSRYHDKPTVESRPSSNNGWIYTAYAVKVGLPTNELMLHECFDWCLRKGKFVFRTPNKYTPYVSRDEILGAAYLGLLRPEHLNGWNFSPFPMPEFSATQLVKQLKLLYENRTDRNYFWKNNLDQIYRFAFSVPVVDRYFLLKTWGTFQWYNPAHVFYAAVAKVDAATGTDSGIRFLKYGKSAVAMTKEFPVDHPLTIKVNSEL